MKEEKILKKIDKLLKLYGVDDETRKQFLVDIQDQKYDEDEIVEETDKEVEGEQPETETPEKVEEGEKVEETEGAETPTETTEGGEVEETGKDEEVAKEGEEVVKPEETTTIEEKDHAEEVQKTIEGVVARITALEETITKLTSIVEKLGVPEKQEMGLSPSQEGEAKGTLSTFDRINKLRTGK